MSRNLACCFAFILFALNNFNVAAQRHRVKLKLIEAPWDETIHALVIPDNIFSLKADGLVMHLHQRKNVTEPQLTFDIEWPSLYDEGSADLIVTQKQIILTSGHNNPNPDYLYWFTDINKQQYQAITFSLKAHRYLFEEYKDITDFYKRLAYKAYLPEKSHLSYKDSGNKRYLNTRRLITLFNQVLKQKDQIVIPDKKTFQRQSPLITAFNASEINDFIIKFNY